MGYEEALRKALRAKRARSNSAPQQTPNSGPISTEIVQRARANSQQLLPGDVLSLQRTVGNQSVQRLLSRDTSSRPPSIQRDEAEEGETAKNDQEGEFHLSDEEIEMGEEKGFELIDESSNETGEYYLGDEDVTTDEPKGFELIDESPTPSSPSYSRYTRPSKQPKQKESLRAKFKRYGRIAKQFVKNQTVNSYGKLSIHSIMNYDERIISKAERAAKTNPDEARKLLRAVHRVIKQDISEISSIGKGIRIALMAPIWFTRWQIAHARWKALAKQLGLIRPKAKPEQETQPVVKPEETEQHEWWRANPEQKDFFGGLHVSMLGVGMKTKKGEGMTDRQKLLQQQKWRMNELSDQGVIAGKHRSDHWIPSFVRKGQERDSTPGVKLGKQRWHMQKPSGWRKTDFRLGGHRPEWGFKMPSGDQSGIKLGTHRPEWGFEKPSGPRTGFKAGFKLGKQRPDWGFDMPGGGNSGFKLGSHRPEWGFNKPSGDKSKFKMGKYRQWGFDKPSGERSGGITTSQHRIPWQKAQARILHLPGSAPEMGSHRNAPTSNEVSGDVTTNETSVEESTTSTTQPVETVGVEQGSSLKIDELYLIKKSLVLYSVRSGEKLVFTPGTKVIITEFKGDEARVDSYQGSAGYAPIAEVKAALGIDS